MTSDFLARFAAATADPPADPPLSLQLLFPDGLELPTDAVTQAVRDYHPELSAAEVELSADAARIATALSEGGPPPACLGLIRWGRHVIKLAGCDAPMPYGPVETCVGPAMVAPPLKVDAKQHRSHVLLYYAGSETDPIERYVALAAVAGALARLGAIMILNEEARAAVPALDLIPEPGEDALATLRGLPIPYLWGGFVKLDVGDSARPWVRSFANPGLGLPDLATHLPSHDATSRAFGWFAGMLGYALQLQVTFQPGDGVDLGDLKLRLREPTEAEWFLESRGTMLVIEPE